jgi:hypothetical protein
MQRAGPRVQAFTELCALCFNGGFFDPDEDTNRTRHLILVERPLFKTKDARTFLTAADLLRPLVKLS